MAERRSFERTFVGIPPRITFTADFHELVRGDLRPGASVLLRYDPRRIVPPGMPYSFGDPAHQFFAHVPGPRPGETLVVPLVSRGGVIEDPDYDATGIGSLLIGRFTVPGDAETVAVWFSHHGPEGGEETDNDYGRNFVFGFPSQQIRVTQASVSPSASGDRFALSVAAAPNVRRVAVHFRTVGNPPSAPTDLDLRASGSPAAEHGTTWILDPASVQDNAVVRFKLYYWISQQRLKDDNAGDYYLVHEGAPEQVPAPPPELAAAAARWR